MEELHHPGTMVPGDRGDLLPDNRSVHVGCKAHATHRPLGGPGSQLCWACACEQDGRLGSEERDLSAASHCSEYVL